MSLKYTEWHSFLFIVKDMNFEKSVIRFFSPLVIVASISKFDNLLWSRLWGSGCSQRQLVECKLVGSLWRTVWQFCHMSFIPAILAGY